MGAAGFWSAGLGRERKIIERWRDIERAGRWSQIRDSSVCVGMWVCVWV